MRDMHEAANQSAQPSSRDAAPGDDVNAKALFRTALVIIATLTVCGVATYLLWKEWRPGATYDGPNAAFDFKLDGAVLESAPQADRKAYEAQKARLLDSLQWVDPQAGIARIPLDQAMRIMAERGRKPAPSDARRQP